jgi:beta-glucosidase
VFTLIQAGRARLTVGDQVRRRRARAVGAVDRGGGVGGGPRLVVTVPVTNTGDRRGTEVVQCYVAPIAARLLRPPKELAGFAKVRLDPGETATVRIELDDRAFAYWDAGRPDGDSIAARATALVMRRPAGPARTPGWQVDPGRYELHVGRSSAAIDHVLPVEITG